MVNHMQPKSARKVDSRHILLGLLAVSTIATAVFHLHWLFGAGIVAAGFVWFEITQSPHVSWPTYLALAAAVCCLLLLQFGNLSVETGRLVNWGFLALLAGLLVASLWQLVASGMRANREIRGVASQFDSLRRR